MDEILPGSTAVTAAAAGRLLAESCAEAQPRSVGWLAVARITALEIWVERSGGGHGRALAIANETEMDGHIVAATAVPCGNGQDQLLLVTETFAWELMSLRRKNSPVGRAGHVGETGSEGASRIQLSLLASGSFRCASSAQATRDSQSPILLSVRGPDTRHDTDGRPSPRESETTVVCSFEGTLALVVFNITGECEAPVATGTTQASFPLQPDCLRGLEIRPIGNEHISSPHSGGFLSGSPSPPTSSKSPMVVDSALLCQGGSGARAVIALLVEESGRGVHARDVEDICPSLCVRTFEWGVKGDDALSLGNWFIEKLILGTRITAHTKGGLLCVSCDGVRTFDGNGNPLRGVATAQRKKTRSKVSWLDSNGSWEYTGLAQITPFVSKVWPETTSAFTQGDAEDFLVTDVDGGLHCLSIVASDQFLRDDSNRRTTRGDEPERSGCPRIDCAKIRTRNGLKPPLPRNASIVLPVGSSGLIFAAEPSYCLIVTIRPAATCVPTVGIERGFAPHAGRAGLGSEPSLPWEMVFAEPLGDDLSPVCGIALVGEDRGPGLSHFQKETSRNSSPKRSRSPGNFEEDVAGLDLPAPRRIRTEGVRAVTISSNRKNDPADGIDYSTACLSILEHGLGLNATAEGPTGLPDGATLFAQPLLPSDHCCGKLRQGSGGTGSGAGKDIEESVAEDPHVLLFSDRVRSRTHVMLVSPDGEVAPLLVRGQGFDLELHTIHLGLAEPEGLIIQITQASVNILEPQGLLQIGCWHQPDLHFKAQFGATAGRLIAVVCNSTMILLEVDAPTSSKAERAVRELHRVELDNPASALAMRTIGDAQTWAGGPDGTNKTLALISVASWGRRTVTVFSWSIPRTSEDYSAPSAPVDLAGRGLVEVATWCPPWEADTADGSASSGLIQDVAARGSLTRALALVCATNDQSKQMSLVAGAVDGSIAVAEWQESGKDKGRQRRGAVGEHRRMLVTSAYCQVGRGPVRFELFCRSSGRPSSHGGEGSERCSSEVSCDGERLYINGSDMDAVLRHCSVTERSPTERKRSVWRCTQVCKTSLHSRRTSVVNLPHYKCGKKSSSSGGDFAWLTSTQHPNNIHTVQSDGRGSGATNTEGNYGTHNANFSRQLVLSFGTLDMEMRGKRHQRALRQEPTHLAYVPVTRSIVVAFCGGKDNEEALCVESAGASRGDAGQTHPVYCNRSLCSLRVFDADTLEERPGGPLLFLPGVRVTGIAPLGTSAPSSVPLGTNVRVVGQDTPAAAVGGGVIAVACCCQPTLSADIKDQAGCRTARKNGPDDTVFSEPHDPDTPVTVISAFEVVVYGKDGVLDNKSNKKGGASAGCRRETSPSTNASVSSCENNIVDDDCWGGTFLAPLAGLAELAGTCFNLEVLGTRYVAASVNDRVVVMGLIGRDGGLRHDRPSPPLRLDSVASCRTAKGGCVTALSACGQYMAIAECFHSVSLYRFDEVSKTLCLVARHVRRNQVVTALALSPRLLFGADAERGAVSGSRLIAVADRTTATVAIFSFPLLDSKEEPPPSPIDSIDTSATAPGRNGGIERNDKRNDGDSDGGDVNGRSTPPGLRSLRLVTVWCLGKVKCLEAVGSMSSDLDDDGDYPYRSENLSSAGSGGNVFGVPGHFLSGTASGAVMTLRVPSPSASR